MTDTQSSNGLASDDMASRFNRFRLFAAFLVVGLVSLIQPGCDCSSSSNGGGSVPSAITSVSPASNSSNVLVSTNVKAVFLNDMDSASVIAAFSLSLNGAPVMSTVTYDVVTKTATLVPASDLASSLQYRAAIDSTVKDSNGGFPLPEGFIWSFSISSNMQLVSKDSSGVIANDISQSADIDGTGRYIVFESNATNLDAAFTISPGGPSQVYRKDTVTGEVLLVSVGSLGVADNQAVNPSISSNGRYVVFESNATNLDTAIMISPGGPSQIFLKDLVDGSIDLVSRSRLLAPDNSTNGATNPGVSDDGRFIVFESADSDLSLINGNTIIQIYRKDMNDEFVEMISRSAGGTAGDGASTNPDMSADGTHVVFESIATNFSTTSGIKHIYYVNTNITHAVDRVSVTTAGLDADAPCNVPSVSNDGLIIVFHTDATNLDLLDTGGFTDVYYRDRASMPSPSTKLVSINRNGTGSGNDDSSNAHINGNGTFVVFESLASDLIVGDTNGIKDIFVRNLAVALPGVSIDRVNNPVDGAESTFPIDRTYQHQPVISTDGRYVGFHSLEPYTGDGNTLSDVFRAYNSTSQ